MTAGTFGTTGGVTWFRFTVDAAAPKPHRDGESQESCPRPAMPLSRKTAPLSTTSASTVTTSSGIVLSEESTEPRSAARRHRRDREHGYRQHEFH